MLNKQVAVVLGLIGLALVAVGVIIGFMPVKSDGFDCGSAFKESSGLLDDELTDTMIGGTGENGCDEARSTRQVLTWAPIGLGSILAFGAFIGTQIPEKQRSSTS